MRRNNKSTYLILALICLVLFNIGSMIIQLNKDNSLIKALPTFNIKTLILETFNISPKGKVEFNKIKDNIVDEEDYDIEKMEDFIIINTLEEYESLIIVRDSQGKNSIENIPEPLNISKVKLDKTKPYIFIYHTHATEGYKPFESDSYYTTNNNKNVIRIGNTMTKVLEASEHKIIHETKHHDRPSFNKSYSRSLNTLNKVKEENDNLKFFFDIHRDGIDKDAVYYERFLAKSKIKINDMDVATFSLVVGPDNPNYEKVLGFAKYIKAVSDALYPEICTGIIIKPIGKYNLFVSDYAALIEVGSNLNTIDEANECAKLVGEILDIVIRGLAE